MAQQAWWVLLLAGIATILCTAYAFRNLGINTDITDMLSPDLPFQQTLANYHHIFPQHTNSIVVVTEANTPEMAHATVTTLAARLRNQKDLVTSVYAPSGGRFFDTHSLLYLTLTDLHELSETVGQSQPYISQLLQDRSLRGLFTMLNDSYDRTGWTNERLVDSLFLRMSEAIRASSVGLNYTLSWHSVILNQDPTDPRTVRFLLVQPRLDYHKLLPAGPVLQAIRRAIDESNVLTIPGVRVRVTGEVALAHEELLVVSQRAGLAALLALIMVCLTLLVAFRSWRLMLATLVMLVVGLALSAGFATITVGHLNIISLTFAVLFIGLVVDYAIHLCLRYRELLGLGELPEQALGRSVQDVGPALLLCTITTAIGFYAFVPTKYTGISELGLISGTGMFIGFLVSLTVLPAMLTILPPRHSHRWPTVSSARARDSVYEFPLRHGRAIRWGTLALLLLSLTLLPWATFDRNPHNLRDPHSESVSTLRDLLEGREGAPWTLTALASDEDAAWDYASQFSHSETVDKVLMIHDFVPMDQLEKFSILQDMADHFLPQSTEQRPQALTAHPEDLTPTLQSFLTRLDHYIKGRNGTREPGSAVRLRAQGRTLLAELHNLEDESKRGLLERLDQSLLGSLPTDLTNPAPSERMGMVSVEKLPQELYERWVSEDGIYRIEVLPKEDLSDTIALRHFVDEVRGIAPQATGLPVSYLNGSQEVIRAFRQAFVLAILAIAGILGIVFRKLRDTLLVILPLCLAGLLTSAVTVVLNTPFNYANILALPLIFGLGADSGIHIVERLRRMPAQCGDFLRSSTIRGVFFSGLTTILSFSSLAYTPHLGVSSMGQLLALGVLLTLVSTLVVLPAFLYAGRHQLRAHPSREDAKG